eukprot:m.1107250 g.1107250  ORF g.1107250 m.1107250 type:complete len:127 (+) comp24348_c0_seq2:435-815(+)
MPSIQQSHPHPYPQSPCFDGCGGHVSLYINRTEWGGITLQALKALQELGLDPNAWGDMKTSARVVECRPHTDEFQRDQKVVVCHEDYKKILKYSLHKARALLVLPNMGTVATVSEYLSQWQVLYSG